MSEPQNQPNEKDEKKEANAEVEATDVKPAGQQPDEQKSVPFEPGVEG